MSDRLEFQDIILQLTEFWKDHGCLVWHPHNVQVGAGTMNPATVLRVLGPEPWNVVYVEPSIRPDDGRFGDNPYRMQQHYQLQVILKPDPGNPQELYLQSLEAIGVNLQEHDVRFVEDNWEQPALGAWGLGWEVWLDGQEITQFTYFQQAGGIDLDPVSVEITYGLDRIALALQGVDSVWELDFGAGTNYGDLLLQSEIEHCNYYFNVADVDALKRVYDAYEKEALRCLDADLVAPAHDFNLKCSFLFNVMDTRGAIGVTERAHYFGRMRRLARQVSEKYLLQRQRVEYPFMDNDNWANTTARADLRKGPRVDVDTSQTFVLEIGSEELPAGDLAAAIRHLQAFAPPFFEKLRLTYERLVVRGTPRRLAIIVNKLAPRQDDLEIEVKGPPADRAYDLDGNPTQAAIGFARSRGVRTSDLKIISEGERSYVAAVVREKGRSAIDVLAEALPELIASIRFEKSMRWNASNISYSRPLRWLVALYGSQIVPFVYADVASDRVSRGLRPAGSPAIVIEKASGYKGALAKNGIVLQSKERRAVIITAAANLAADVGGSIQDDRALLDEVANLVEQPTLLRGSFEKRFLKLPPEVLVAVMKKHQRYFPVYAEDGRNLLPYFITVKNGGNQHLDIVRKGNEHVIRARFSDAEFFYNRDIERPLEAYLPRLDTLTFQHKLGSMLDKSKRLQRLVPVIADMLGLSEDEKSTAARAAVLSKADLATSLVVEMTSLQGIMGGQYARNSGESEEVAAAIAEQYEPVSKTRPGLALALADRIDSLAGLFAVDLAPRGSNDPFALRRAAIQIIENLISNQIRFDLRQALQAAAGKLPVEAGKNTIAAALEFVAGRLETTLQDQGIRTSVVRAVLAEQGADPYSASLAAKELDEVVKQETWSGLLDAYSRCVRITRDEEQHEHHPQRLSLEAEQDLWATYQRVAQGVDGSVPSLVQALRELEPAISRFFEDVLVMDEDLLVRQNRLALVREITRLSEGIADLSYLEGF